MSLPLLLGLILASLWRLGVWIRFLWRLARMGLYGDLAARAGEAFESRWFADGRKVEADILERPDFSSTTDLYAVVKNVYAMRTAIFDIQALLSVVAATFLPFAPIWLSAIPFSTIVNHLVDGLL